VLCDKSPAPLYPTPPSLPPSVCPAPKLAAVQAIP